MQRIALETGVSTATVSLALRDKGRMSAETRARVKAAAAVLDYHAHPVISQACSLARRATTQNYRETLAFITEYPMENCGYYQQTLHDSAKEQAIQQGYKLEHFIVSGKRAEQQRLSRILVARGIRGLIFIQRLNNTQPRLYFDWKYFAAVEIHRTMWNPRNLHHIDTVDYHKILEAIHLLKKVGFKRVGMAVEPSQNHYRRGIYNAASLMVQSRLPAAKRIPPLLSFGEWNETTFKSWFYRFQPDVLYIHQNPEIMRWIENLGLRVPEDISLFCANVQTSEISGLRRDFAGMGRSAVEMVSLLLGNNSLGLAGNPRCWLVDELWQAGKTLRYSIADYVTEEGFLK